MIEIKFNQAQTNRIIEAMCFMHYKEEVDDDLGGKTANPLSREEFATNAIIQYVENKVTCHETNMARENAVKQLPASDFSLEALKKKRDIPGKGK